MTDTLMTVAGLVLTVVVPLTAWAVRTLSNISNRLLKMEQQISPNHGTSMRDAVDRIESSVENMTGAFEQHLRDSSYDLQRTDIAIAALQNK